MRSSLPTLALVCTAALFALARCGTTQPLPELVDAGTDAGTALRITTASLSQGIPQVPYLEQLQATGGVPPRSWTLDQRPASGFAWLQFNADGDLFGTPDQISTGNLAVTVRDSAGASASATLPITIVACQEGAQYPCEVGDAGTCELGVQTCSGGTFSGCGSQVASQSRDACGPGCAACDPTVADHCVDGGTCACGNDDQICDGGTNCCPGVGCADLAADPRHCGSCEQDCFAAVGAHVDAGCASSTCSYACDAPYADCDGQLGTNGCESNLLTDVNHCGTCGTNCAAGQNLSDAGCGGGTCSIVCTPPSGGNAWKDCDRNFLNGCEVNIDRDRNSCGACADAGGVNCPALPHVNTVTIGCDGGVCGVHGNCASGYQDCNGVVSDGCERNINSDPNACGTSCTVCPGPVGGNGTAVCNSGTCGIQCSSGYNLCGNQCVVFGTTANCTGCGDTCNGGYICGGTGCCKFGNPGC